jgi:hypothetical protein
LTPPGAELLVEGKLRLVRVALAIVEDLVEDCEVLTLSNGLLLDLLQRDEEEIDGSSSTAGDRGVSGAMLAKGEGRVGVS